MANVRKHRRKWQAQWHYTIDGERKQATRLFDTKGEAKRYADRMAEQVERQGIVDPHRFTVRAYCVSGSTIIPSATLSARRRWPGTGGI